MTDAFLAMLFIFVGIFIQWFWTWKIAVPTCRSCQAKSSPHISQALIRARHEADSADDAAKRWDEAACPYATPEALREALREMKRQLKEAESEMDKIEQAGGDAPHREVTLATRIRVQMSCPCSSSTPQLDDRSKT